MPAPEPELPSAVDSDPLGPSGIAVGTVQQASHECWQEKISQSQACSKKPKSMLELGEESSHFEIVTYCNHEDHEGLKDHDFLKFSASCFEDFLKQTSEAESHATVCGQK